MYVTSIDLYVRLITLLLENPKKYVTIVLLMVLSAVVVLGSQQVAKPRDRYCPTTPSLKSTLDRIAEEHEAQAVVVMSNNTNQDTNERYHTPVCQSVGPGQSRLPVTDYVVPSSGSGLRDYQQLSKGNCVVQTYTYAGRKALTCPIFDDFDNYRYALSLAKSLDETLPNSLAEEVKSVEVSLRKDKAL